MQINEQHLADMLTGVARVQAAIIAELCPKDPRIRNALMLRLGSLCQESASNIGPLACLPAQLALEFAFGGKPKTGPVSDNLAAHVATLLSSDAYKTRPDSH